MQRNVSTETNRERLSRRCIILNPLIRARLSKTLVLRNGSNSSPCGPLFSKSRHLISLDAPFASNG